MTAGDYDTGWFGPSRKSQMIGRQLVRQTPTARCNWSCHHRARWRRQRITCSRQTSVLWLPGPQAHVRASHSPPAVVQTRTYSPPGVHGPQVPTSHLLLTFRVDQKRRVCTRMYVSLLPLGQPQPTQNLPPHSQATAKLRVGVLAWPIRQFLPSHLSVCTNRRTLILQVSRTVRQTSGVPNCEPASSCRTPFGCTLIRRWKSIKLARRSKVRLERRISGVKGRLVGCSPSATVAGEGRRRGRGQRDAVKSERARCFHTCHSNEPRVSVTCRTLTACWLSYAAVKLKFRSIQQRVIHHIAIRELKAHPTP